MSAFGGKADSDQPPLTNLDLWVHGLAVLLGVLLGIQLLVEGAALTYLAWRIRES